MSVKWHRLGEFIEEINRRNTDLIYGQPDVRGVTNAKGIIKTKANIEGRSLAKFYVIHPGEFVFNRRVHDKLGLGFNNTDKTYIFTEDYSAFRVIEGSGLMPDFLYLFFCRNEFDRTILYNAWGSATLFFNIEDMQRVMIPVPSIAEQRKAVEAWQGLRSMKEQNEQAAEPLMQLCRSYLEECKKKYPGVRLGDFIEASDERNHDGRYGVSNVRGVSIEKRLIETKADMTNVSLKPYKLFKPDEFCVVPVTSRNGGKISLACNTDGEAHIVSAAYDVFRVTDKCRLLPRFLFMVFNRPEFDRYARFNSWGSARESFSFAEMCRVKIPLPPIEVQQAVVDIFKAAQEAKRIAAEADKLSREICPALIRRAVA